MYNILSYIPKLLHKTYLLFFSVASSLENEIQKSLQKLRNIYNSSIMGN
jgi:hypothetical protein